MDPSSSFFFFLHSFALLLPSFYPGGLLFCFLPPGGVELATITVLPSYVILFASDASCGFDAFLPDRFTDHALDLP